MAAGGVRLWSGSVSFGLVTVPVAVAPAVHSRRSAFHLVHKADRSRIRRRMYCPEEKNYVHPEHIQRGYEAAEGQYVVVLDSEIEAIEPDKSKTIEIRQFVAFDAIDPAYYDRPYYLVPTGAEKPYRLLVEAMAERRRVGISEFVMHAREHFCAVASIDGALCLLTLRYPQQLRSGEGLSAAKAKKEHVAAMAEAIEKAAKPFDPAEITDEYQKRVDRLIERKKRRHEVVELVGGEAEGELEAAAGADVDLIAALEESLAKERRKAG